MSPQELRKTLTETELELMQIIWQLGEANVKQVMATLPPERDLAYTSVSTILRILEKKGVLATRKEGRGHVYLPKLEKTDFESASVERVVDQVFLGDRLSMIRTLVDGNQLSDDEAKELKAMIEETLS